MSLIDKVNHVRNNLTAYGVLTAAAAAVGGFFYITTGSTLPGDNTVPNDWGKSCHTTVNLEQSGRISLDFSKYGKDAANQTRFDLPTTCSKADTLADGEEILNKFRWGSFVTEWGSSSRWNMSALHTEQPAGADQSICSVELTLRERRAGFITHGFIKDYFNAKTFDWEVPCDVHDRVDVGHNFVDDPFRAGSLTRRLVKENSDISTSAWSVEVSAKHGPVAAMQ